MSSVKISALPPIGASALTDVGPFVQAGVTYKATLQQLQALFGGNFAPIASPIFTGVVTLPTPFTLGATSVTTTGTQLNLLSTITLAPITKISTQRITASGAGTYTPTTGMKYVIVRAQAAGAGGGGAATTVNPNISGGGGGGGGEYIEALFTAAQIGASKAYSVGAKGAGGTAGNNAGSNGANTTFNTTFIIAVGGSGGSGSASTDGTVSQFVANGGIGGTGGSVATGSLIRQIAGGAGATSFSLTSQVISGTGGESGAGGSGAQNARATLGNNAAANSGAGGSGGSTQAQSAVAGGDGADGFIEFIEYISA